MILTRERRHPSARVSPWVASLLLALVVAAAAAPSALGATVRRTWHAELGGAGASGSVVLFLNTNLTGEVQITMRGLPPLRTYKLSAYVGTCANPATVASMPTVRSSTTGGVARTVAFTNRAGGAIWLAATRSTIAIRLASGSETHCGVLSYPVATRVVIARYGIDLPIVRQKGSAFPLCAVALYLASFSQPGEPGPTFVFAHARVGMFLPLLNASLVKNGVALIGMTIKVWTSDNRLWTYVVSRVLRHQYVVPNYDSNVEQLWIQTSEGPRGTRNKLFLEAHRVSTAVTSFAAAHPTPHPLVCS